MTSLLDPAMPRKLLLYVAVNALGVLLALLEDWAGVGTVLALAQVLFIVGLLDGRGWARWVARAGSVVALAWGLFRLAPAFVAMMSLGRPGAIAFLALVGVIVANGCYLWILAQPEVVLWFRDRQDARDEARDGTSLAACRTVASAGRRRDRVWFRR